MKSTGRLFTLLMCTLLLLSQTACSAQPQLDQDNRQPVSRASKAPPAVPSDAALHTGPFGESRATVAQVQFAYPHSRCAYPYSPTNFCDTIHIEAYTQALEEQAENFASDLILVDVPTRPDYHQKSLVVIEPDTGVVWPFPFDAYAGSLDAHGNPVGEGALDFSIDSSTVCIEGSLLVYRVIESGRFCFTFNGGNFSGHTTQYMAPEHCNADGHCQTTLVDIAEAVTLCDGASPTLYGNKGRDSFLLACECNCTSHDNTGWLVDGASGQVQGVALGKPAVATELDNVDAVSDLLASHPFCEAFDSGSLQAAEFVSLIKYPTGDEDAPYCFSPRTFAVSKEGVVINDNGRNVPKSDEEVFLDTSADVAATVLALARQVLTD